MPKHKAKFQEKSRVLDVRPDRYDIRDRLYQPKLVNLPGEYPEPDKTKKLFETYCQLILDQGTEGACTGFGLAATINYLRFRQSYQKAQETKSKAIKLLPKVSERMLYEHARLYDEWPGEDYEGSSCRGAIKGWHRHGVCLQITWPYLDEKEPHKPGKPKANWAVEAGEITLGAYYRIDVRDVSAMQSAIYEVGAIYVSAMVHKGWDLLQKKSSAKNHIPLINYEAGFKESGGHAFALVGYDRIGFIVQNSWGQKWGYHGFARLAYEDWLKHGVDAWVVAMGVPAAGQKMPEQVSSSARNRIAQMGQPVRMNSTSRRIWPEDLARRYALVLGNEGIVQRSSAAYGTEEFVQQVLMEEARAWIKKSANHRHLAVYVHGGLNDEEAGIRRVQTLAPCFEQNGIFPLFVVWKTGWLESLHDIGEDVIRKFLPKEDELEKSGGPIDWLKKKVRDGADYTIETTLGFLGRSLWQQMKQNAEAANNKWRGGEMLVNGLAQLQKNFPDLKIHYVGHSAGSIWLGHTLTYLSKLDEPLSLASCQLMAPACTVPFALEKYKVAIEQNRLPAKKFWIYNLSDQAERNDTVAKFYGKSLLYFVSRACEEKHKMPILGMEAVWNKNLDREDIYHADFAKQVNEWRKFVQKNQVPDLTITEAAQFMNDGKKKSAPSHGGFDNDIGTINQVLLRILGRGVKTGLAHPVKDLSDLEDW